MSAQPYQSSGSSDGQSAGGGGRFSTLIGSLAAATSADRAAQDEPAAQDDGADGRPATPPRPTFTARASGPATAVAPGPAHTPGPDGAGSRVRRAPAPDTPPDAAAPPSPTAPTPVTPAPAATAPVPATPAPVPPAPAPADAEGTRALPRPAAAAPGEPLLGDVAALRARWQRVQASFVDGPREAVGDAADLIEQTAQALVGALRQRQRQLRMMWESGAKTAPSDGEPTSGEPDTEHLRQMMQHYRALFNQLCRP